MPGTTKWRGPAWIGDYLDPNTFLDMYTSNSGNNDTGWSNPRYDALIAQAGETTDREGAFRPVRGSRVRPDDGTAHHAHLHLHEQGTGLPGRARLVSDILDIHPYKYISLVQSAD